MLPFLVTPCLVVAVQPCMERIPIKKKKKKKVAEMLKTSGDTGVRLVADLANDMIRNGTIPSDWENSYITNIYKGKGDALIRGNYRGLKLLDHVMKEIKRVKEKIIRKRVFIDDMQYGFMSGRGTNDAIFILKQLQEKHLAKKRKLFFAFVDP